MSMTVNFPRDTTLKDLVAVQRANLLGSGDATTIDRYYNGLARQNTTKAGMDALFVEWWNLNWKDGETTYNDLLARWFGNVLDDDRVHGVKKPLFGTSTTAIAALTDDSAGLVCTPSTEAAAERDDFAGLCQFWCIEVAADKNADGTHTIYAVELIDDEDTVRRSAHLCWVLQKNTYTREWNQDGYQMMKMRCHRAAGYTTWDQGTDKNGTVYPYMANPKYAAGLNTDGTIGCGSGLPPVNYISHTGGVTLWRKRGAQYSGASGNLLKWQMAMIWLKYGVKGNSGTIEGCTGYNFQYTAAVGEAGVERVILTTAQAANLFAGSNVIVGVKGGSTDRGDAQMYSICKNKKIKSITSVTIDGTEYAAVNIDNGGTTFDTTAGSTYLSTMPYWSGWNDTVQGNDGSRFSATSGKETGLIQKTEFQNGAYMIVSDELWQWGKNDDGDFTFDVFKCADQSKVTAGGNISADYVRQEDLQLVFPAATTAAWWYIEDTAIGADRSILWPASVSTKAGSGTGCKAGFFVYPAASGVRAAWRCCCLNSGGNASLAACLSSVSVGYEYWYGGVGAPGLAG